MNCVIYCRVSSKEQLEGTSLASQEIACREYARAHHLTVLNHFIEQGESAKFADRTQLLELIDFCRGHRGQVDALLVWKLDRFARNVEDHYHLKATLAKYGVHIVSVTEPIDPNPNGKLLETILAGFAQFDNDIRAMRTVQGMRRKIQEGIYPTKAPLGYVSVTPSGEKKTQPDRADPARFDLLQRAWRLFATGAYSKAEIRRLLTSWGVTTRLGAPLSAQAVDNLFVNSFYAGILIDPGSGEEYEGRHVPMVTRKEFAQVQRLLGRSPRAVPHQKTHANFPLRGFVRCPDCGRYFTASLSRGRTRRYGYYYCSQNTCDSRRTNYSTAAIHDEFNGFLDTLTVTPKLFEALDETIFEVSEERRAFAKAKESRQRDELAVVKRHMQELIRMRTENLITDQEFVAQKTGLQERKMALEGALQPDTVTPETVRQDLADITGPLTALLDTWTAFPEALRPRFVRCLLPVGFAAGQVRTAELGLLFRVFGRLRDGNTSAVPLSGENPNQVYEEISAFAELFRDAEEVRKGRWDAVRKNDDTYPILDKSEPPHHNKGAEPRKVA